MILKRELFPHPLGPQMSRCIPGRTVRLCDRQYEFEFSIQSSRHAYQAGDDDVPAGRDDGDAVEDDGAVARLHDAALDGRRAAGSESQGARLAIVQFRLCCQPKFCIFGYFGSIHLVVDTLLSRFLLPLEL